MHKHILVFLSFLLAAPLLKGQEDGPAAWMKQAQSQKDTAKFNLIYKSGKYYQEHENLDSALICMKQALDLARAIKYPKGLALTLNDMGLIYRYYDQFDDAVKVLLESLKISEKNGYKELEINSMFTLALVYGDQTDFTEALLYNRKVLDQSISTNDSFRMIKSYTYFGDIYGNMQQYDSSVFYLKKGIELTGMVRSQPMPVIMQARMNLV